MNSCEQIILREISNSLYNFKVKELRDIHKRVPIVLFLLCRYVEAEPLGTSTSVHGRSCRLSH